MSSGSHADLARREVLGLGAAAVAVASSSSAATAPAGDPYSALLKTWCEGLLERQVRALPGKEGDGGFLCPGCGMIHGRSADAIYPLLRMARTTGSDRYVQAAKAVYAWGERNVGRPDGSWVNDVFLNDWKGITVFRVIAMAEALIHHGDLLDAATRAAWRARLAQACTFIDGFITMDVGNINYPISSAYAFSLAAEVLDRPGYEVRAKGLAHAALDYFTPNGLLFGEGRPQRGRTAKGRYPVDLGYNIEESLPALAMYAVRAKDQAARDQVVASLRAHMEFMLPDGGWDNSWGTRNFKWTWWGSRTSDGCHAAYRLLADQDPRFAEVSLRNLALMGACTHDGLLYGGPDYREHGYRPCIHHTFSHASSLAAVIDLGVWKPVARRSLPRDAAYGLRSFPEIGTHLVSVGPWRATFTDYDFDYLAPAGGGHASGGAVSLLYHQALGPVLAASMTRYKAVEIGNQQAPTDASHQPLGPRIEVAQGRDTFTSLSDFGVEMVVGQEANEVRVAARGRLCTPEGRRPTGDPTYELKYQLTAQGMTIEARCVGVPEGARLIVPIIARASSSATRRDTSTVVVAKSGGRIVVQALGGAVTLPDARIFNLVPGLEAAALSMSLDAEGVARMHIAAEP